MAVNTAEPSTTEKKAKITLRGAIFIGIGSMVGAGIFALFGQAGAIAGAAGVTGADFMFAGAGLGLNATRLISVCELAAVL